MVLQPYLGTGCIWTVFDIRKNIFIVCSLKKSSETWSLEELVKYHQAWRIYSWPCFFGVLPICLTLKINVGHVVRICDYSRHELIDWSIGKGVVNCFWPLIKPLLNWNSMLYDNSWRCSPYLKIKNLADEKSRVKNGYSSIRINNYWN